MMLSTMKQEIIPRLILHQTHSQFPMRGLELQISVSDKKNLISIIRILSPEGTLGTGIKPKDTIQTTFYTSCNRERQIKL